MFPGFGMHPIYLLFLLAIVLIIFGPGKLPEVGAALGRGISEFRRASSEVTREIQRSVDEPAPRAAVPEEPAKPSAEPATANEPKPNA